MLLYSHFQGNTWCGFTLPVPRHTHMHAHPRTGNREQVVGSISLGRAVLSVHSYNTSLPGIFLHGAEGSVMLRIRPLSSQSPQSSGEPVQEAAAVMPEAQDRKGGT